MLNICNDHGFFAIISFLSAVSGGRVVGKGGEGVVANSVYKKIVFICLFS